MKIWNELMEVTVEAITICKGSGSLRALADVRVGPFVLRGCAVVEHKQFNGPGRHAAPKLQAYPPRTMGRDNMYHNVVQVEERELFQRIQSTILISYDAMIASETKA